MASMSTIDKVLILKPKVGINVDRNRRGCIMSKQKRTIKINSNGPGPGRPTKEVRGEGLGKTEF